MSANGIIVRLLFLNILKHLFSPFRRTLHVDAGIWFYALHRIGTDFQSLEMLERNIEIKTSLSMFSKKLFDDTERGKFERMYSYT